MSCQQLLNDTRNLVKWLNEESTAPLDRTALARVLATVIPVQRVTLNRADLLTINERLKPHPNIDAFKITTIDHSSTSYSLLVSNMNGDIL